MELIKEIRLKMPEDLKQAKWVREERERILEEARKEAEDVVKEAENRIIAMIDEHEITKKAYEQKMKLWNLQMRIQDKLRKELKNMQTIS